jgi:hypothetical protein
MEEMLTHVQLQEGTRIAIVRARLRMTRERWLETVSVAFAAALGGAAGAILLTLEADGLGDFRDVAFVSVIGAIPGAVAGVGAAFLYRLVFRWRPGLWATTFLAGVLAGGIGLFGFLWYALSHAGE